VSRLISRGPLDSPFGMAVVPANSGSMSDALLVGNFGDGTIDVFSLSVHHRGHTRRRPPTAEFLGVIGDGSGNPLVIDGLWALKFGVNAGGFSADTLYFTAGPDGETKGVFGKLGPVTR